MCHFPPNFRSPQAPKLLIGHKSQDRPKNGTDMLYQHAKGKMGVFCLFVCLFVCHAYGLCISGL